MVAPLAVQAWKQLVVPGLLLSQGTTICLRTPKNNSPRITLNKEDFVWNFLRFLSNW